MHHVQAYVMMLVRIMSVSGRYNFRNGT